MYCQALVLVLVPVWVEQSVGPMAVAAVAGGVPCAQGVVAVVVGDEAVAAVAMVSVAEVASSGISHIE